jgi:benzoylformate decarboxylase/acetolactate synthase-1/2/3 large subunit
VGGALGGDHRGVRWRGDRGLTEPRYGSDVVVDLLNDWGIRYASLNPGSSFRGLHDSIVNHGQNSPEIVLCPHEKIAVGLAHGYAKSSGELMAVIVHDLVGLLHGAMGIYYAYIDRAPVLVLGGAGPMDLGRRRPNIDWIHSANVQGNAVRDYTKWDDQPAAIGSIPESLVRALRVATSEPAGPVYVALDAALQEDDVPEGLVMPDLSRLRTPSRIGPDPEALGRMAEALVAAERPLIVPGYAGRDPAAFGQLVELAELLGVGVVDTNVRLNFPNRHPLNVTGSQELERSDLVLFVDVKDMGKPTQRLDSTTRQVVSRIPREATVVDLGFNEVGISSWSHDFAQLHPADLQVTADTAVALPELLRRCREAVARENEDRAGARRARRQQLGEVHDAVWEGWRREADAAAGASPVSTARLAAEVWDAISDHDWVLTAGTASDWALRTWDFDRPYRHAGRSLGTATQIGISLGVALAHRDASRLVVDLQPDGDLMFDLGALWVAAYHRIPLLVVMFNNRAYFNDWEHQERIARKRGTPVENAWIGMEIDRPAPDFAAAARAQGWHAEGPVEDPDKVGPAIQRAVEIVGGDRRPALVDVVCQRR